MPNPAIRAALVARVELRPRDYRHFETREPRYSIEARKDGGSWMLLIEGNKPFVYDTANERDEMLAALRARMEAGR